MVMKEQYHNAIFELLKKLKILIKRTKVNLKKFIILNYLIMQI